MIIVEGCGDGEGMKVEEGWMHARKYYGEGVVLEFQLSSLQLHIICRSAACMLSLYVTYASSGACPVFVVRFVFHLLP